MSFRVVQPDPASRICVIGVPGQGKSIYRRQMLRPIYRCTLWNPLGDHNIGETITVDEYRHRRDSYRSGNLRVTVEPNSYSEDGMAEEFNELCAIVEEIGAQHFAIEEIALVADPTRVPANFNRLCIRGRHRAISLAIYGQRFHQFPLIARGTSSEIIAFRQTDPDDVRDFEKRIKPSVAPVPLNQLPDFHFIHWTPEHGAVLCRPVPFDENSDEKIEAHDDVEGLLKSVWEFPH